MALRGNIFRPDDDRPAMTSASLSECNYIRQGTNLVMVDGSLRNILKRLSDKSSLERDLMGEQPFHICRCHHTTLGGPS
ncbi:MAG TPA: hypothetical protein EYG03_20315 [Planctomycetes bacterium]|nr:hypothetical protein [Planctomycetota bacterium]